MIDKTCPIGRAAGDDVLVLKNIEITEQLRDELEDYKRSDGGMPAISLATNDGESYIGPAIARCNGPACAWYDE